MNEEHLWLQLLVFIAVGHGSLPWLLVMLTGGVVCLRRLSTRPRDGWLVGGAITLSLFGAYGEFGVSRCITLLFVFMPGLIGSVTGVWWQLLHSIPGSLAQAAAWGLILYAAFGEGSGPRSKYLVEDEQSEQKSA